MKGSVEERPWYVIQTRSRFEKKCNSFFIKNGFSAYLPLQKRMKVWSDRIKQVDEPLFPGYIFIQFSENERFQILNTPGVVRFLSFGGKYATMNNNEVEIIRKVVSSFSDLEVVDIGLTPGQEVLISSGPFKDNYARLIRHNGKGKLLLSLDCIGKGIVLEISHEYIELPAKLNTLKVSA